jgi:hypothetical protein
LRSRKGVRRLARELELIARLIGEGGAEGAERLSPIEADGGGGDIEGERMVAELLGDLLLRPFGLPARCQKLIRLSLGQEAELDSRGEGPVPLTARR